MVKLEVCVDSINSAIAAEKGGAARIELCAALSEGGLTPSLGLLLATKKACTIPVFVLIRPRGGDFCYNDEEVQVMCHDIRVFKENGADGFVIGALSVDGDVDIDTCKTLMSLAQPLPITFHRAFDLLNEPFTALEQLIDLGFNRILTSGQAASAIEGAHLLSQLISKASERIIVMPGGGINEENIAALLHMTKAKEVHSSASCLVHSQMKFKTSAVKMGASSSEQVWKQCDVNKQAYESMDNSCT